MSKSRVRLPSDVREPYQVYLNGVPQQLGSDFSVREGALVFERELRKDKISGWRWLLGAWGVGTYRQNDSSTFATRRLTARRAWPRGSRSRPRRGWCSRPPAGEPGWAGPHSFSQIARSHGRASFNALSIARVAGERLSV